MVELIFLRDGKSCLRWQLSEIPLKIGRDSNNNVQLTDEDISRCHCTIVWQDGKYILTDLSSNGTYLNNELVKSSPVNIGDTITIGHWVISVAGTSSKEKPTVIITRQPTSVLNFDAEKKTIQTQKLILTVLSPSEKLRTTTITKTEIMIGTMGSCDVPVNDSFVSRRHCQLLLQAGRVLLVDLGSTNGTFVDKVRVEKVSLPAKGEFQIGKTQISYKLEKESENIKPVKGSSLGQMIGQSLAMREVFGLIEKVAPSDATVLITGESGTGKDLVSRLLYQMSHRAQKSFVSVNCGALPASIIESQLFGHEKGAFTGASERMVGLIEQASGGTLFLDEIGEMPLELQTRLLHVLEGRKIKRLGGREEIDVDFRLIAATNKELQQMVGDENFRKDLFYRLYVVPINLKPLRERKEDIIILTERFASDFSPLGISVKFTDAALEKLSSHKWPGNVRELKNVIQRSVLLTGSEIIDAKDISFPPIEDVSERNLESRERDMIIAALRENKNNQSRTAEQLGIARTTLSTKIAKYRIDTKKL